jgi:CRP-like cAMP-binding protein
MDRRLEFVRRLFADVGDDALATIAARVTRRELAVGEQIAIGRCAFMSDVGELESGRIDNGSWRAIAPVGPDEVWNVYGLYYEYEHPNIVRAKTPAAVLELSAAALRDELRTNPALAQCIIDELALALRAAQKSNGKLRDTLHEHLSRARD